MNIAYIGLGKMGLSMAERLKEKGHSVCAYDSDAASMERAVRAGISVAPSLAALMTTHTAPRTVWVMVPHTAVDSILGKLAAHLSPEDTLIDGGNSLYTDTVRRAKKLSRRGIHLLDVGVSGGPDGARRGACMMVGGDEATYERHEQLFKDLSVKNGYAYVGESGAGHFTKMVHNGIEYGMMQAIAEGFDVLRESGYSMPLTDIAHLYNKGSVIESRLMGWLASGFDAYGEDLAGITGRASQSGEGLWTVEAAHELEVPVKVIEDSLKAREKSQKRPSFQGQIVSVLRNQFGGHNVEA